MFIYHSFFFFFLTHLPFDSEKQLPLCHSRLKSEFSSDIKILIHGIGGVAIQPCLMNSNFANKINGDNMFIFN